MLIINPYTGQTLDDPWYESIEQFSSTMIKIRCSILLKEIRPGVIDRVYKHPNTLLFEKAANPMAHAVDLIVNKQHFYTRIFNAANTRVFNNTNEQELTPVQNTTEINPVNPDPFAEEISMADFRNLYKESKYKNMIDKNNSVIRLVDEIFKTYKYGRPLSIHRIKSKTLTKNNDFELIHIDEDIVYMSINDIDRGLDNGSISIDEETGEHTLEDGRIVRIGDAHGRRIRLRNPYHDNDRFIYVSGYYWPIKSFKFGPNNDFNVPGYAMYEHDNEKHTKVFTKNFKDITINDLDHIEQLKAIIKYCKVKINKITDSATIFGRQAVKKKMMLNDKNNNGYDIVDIIPDYECAKDGLKRDIVIIKGDMNYKFCLSDLTIVFPFANTVLKGIIPSKDKTIKVGRKAKIINDKNLKIGKGEIVTIVNVKNNYYHANNNINQTSVVTVCDKGGNNFKVWSNYLKVI
jgi:hypothetical protein